MVPPIPPHRRLPNTVMLSRPSTGMKKDGGQGTSGSGLDQVSLQLTRCHYSVIENGLRLKVPAE